ncbi:conjugative transposon protein TraM [Pedobacter sp. Leaf132]|uniref:conjugative transposon protein TraM n=1 Tax=Pedobacter sp. Leaf132 TaxID=2876557 RepID=UPI001E56446B|nr:conjugative transposon protein TraM [Pedobacter sp. Leaf132]
MMKNIDLKNPRYVLPVICLPFIYLLFYVYSISLAKAPARNEQPGELSSEISPASPQVSGRAIEDKLEAFKQRYKKSDGYTAMSALELSNPTAEELSSAYNAKEKQMLDSINQAINRASKNSIMGNSSKANQNSLSANPAPTRYSEEDRALKALLSQYTGPEKSQSVRQTDPMAIFRAQMAIVDSMNKAAAMPRGMLSKQSENLLTDTKYNPHPLKVSQMSHLLADDSTIMAENSEQGFIQAIIDEPITGYIGSRVPIRLLSEIKVGQYELSKGTILYALISGFSTQRISLSIFSIALKGEILPVNLELYDLDGLKGLYVPASLYREFSRELGASSLSGLTVESSTPQNGQLVSLLGKLFQSTRGAVNKLVRSNKARINYPTRVYLLDKSSNKTKNQL